MKIKRGDVVIILSGKERGMQGRVLRVDTKSDRVFVEGRNIVKCHRKANAVNQESGIISKEASVHISNVAIYSEAAKHGVRVCSRYVGQDDKLYTSKREALESFSEPVAHVAKVRYCAKTGEIFR
ncbi:MAG: 50S ribosomal protein L24 [Proteobacteria bacterium]|nr:50S ribosomal protein L24 [Pseudomonadota bacterium]